MGAPARKAGPLGALVAMVDGRTEDCNAEIVKLADPRLVQQRATVERVCGPTGGHLNFYSSPFVMWLAHRLSVVGDGLVAMVDEDLEEWRRDCTRRERRP